MFVSALKKHIATTWSSSNQCISALIGVHPFLSSFIGIESKSTWIGQIEWKMKDLAGHGQSSTNSSINRLDPNRQGTEEKKGRMKEFFREDEDEDKDDEGETNAKRRTMKRHSHSNNRIRWNFFSSRHCHWTERSISAFEKEIREKFVIGIAKCSIEVNRCVERTIIRLGIAAEYGGERLE